MILVYISNQLSDTMNRDALIEFLQSTNLVTLPVAKEIAEKFTYKTIAKNEFQLKEDKICNEYLFLENGYMRAFAYNTEGNEVTTGFYCHGLVVFEVSSFFFHTRTKENIQAISDCGGWYVNFEQFNNLFHTFPQFREFGRSILVKGFAGLKDRMLSMITETAEERYEQLLKNTPQILQNAPLKNIASYLGITDTSLSRIRKDLAKRS